RLRCPPAEKTGSAFRLERDCSLGAGEESNPAPSKTKRKKMNTTENNLSAPQPINDIVKLPKFPSQPQEWKIVALRECPTTEEMQRCDTPEKAAAYWRAHVAQHPYFNPECE